MSNPTEFFLPQGTSKAAAFGVSIKRWFRTSHGLKVRAHIGSSTSGGIVKDPAFQWVSVRIERGTDATFPQSVITAALDIVYPNRTSGDQGMGNITKTSIALQGGEWVEVEKLLASRAEAETMAKFVAFNGPVLTNGLLAGPVGPFHHLADGPKEVTA